ncbi:hypothetical protein [Nonomuraea sp. NPDC048901]|uniref:hypothetical protein n=1 Tax=Nonomuraea sp. NPDC048901 TaxID=3155627 RepID=UPI0033ED3B71
MSTNLRETTPKDRSPLDVVEHAFQLVTCAPDGLALDGRALGDELPARQIPLTELRDLLISRTLCDATCDVVWRELVIRARGDDRQWLVGAVGVAVPALRRIAGWLRLYLGAQDSADIDSEILTAFLTAVRNIDLTRPDILPRMCAAARQAGERARQRADSNNTRRLSDHSSQEPVLVNAARAGEAESALTVSRAGRPASCRIRKSRSWPGRKMSYQPPIELTAALVRATRRVWSMPAQRDDPASSVRMSWT